MLQNISTNELIQELINRGGKIIEVGPYKKYELKEKYCLNEKNSNRIINNENGVSEVLILPSK